MTTALAEIDRAAQAIAQVKTPPEANILRRKVKAIQELAPKRHENFDMAFKGACAYCEVSAKAGVLWAELEGKRPSGQNQSSQNFDRTISVTDAGFGSAQDAMVCQRIAELTPEERKAYYHKCENDGKLPTLGGMYAFWRVTNHEDLEAPPLPDGKFRVIYADPPWLYGAPQHTDSAPGSKTEQLTVLESHYPSMPLEDICALPIEELAAENAVLFLWATSPLLQDAFLVMNSWGFEYKAAFIWDKVKHNVGYYNSVRHEFLLIGTRGSCLPDDRPEGEPVLFDSVQSIERGDHSVKPNEFRNLIDAMYPSGPRIELFARRPADGWDTWGNQL
jgi:N6-adenosine-specific RNA methylase IME4